MFASDLRHIVLFIFSFVAIICFSVILIGAVISDNLDKIGWLAIEVLIIFLYAVTAFISPTYDGDGHARGFPVLVDRRSGEFVARLPLDEKDNLLIWNSVFINHFKYKVTQGLPLNASFNANFVVYDNSLSHKFVFKVDYEIGPEKESYAKALKQWRTKDEVEDAILAKIGASIADSMNGYFHDFILKSAKKGKSINKMELLIGMFQDDTPSMEQIIKSEIEEALQGVLRQECSNVHVQYVRFTVSAAS